MNAANVVLSVVGGAVAVAVLAIGCAIAWPQIVHYRQRKQFEREYVERQRALRALR